MFPNLQHTAPLGKVSSVFLVLGTALRQPIQPLGSSLCQGYHTLVHLDAHSTTLGSDNLGEGTPITFLLIEHLMEEGDTPIQGVLQSLAVTSSWQEKRWSPWGSQCQWTAAVWQCSQWTHLQPGALAQSHNAVSKVRCLFLLLWGQPWVLVGPGASQFLAQERGKFTWRAVGWRVDSGFNSCSGSGGIFSTTPMRRLLQMSLK